MLINTAGELFNCTYDTVLLTAAVTLATARHNELLFYLLLLTHFIGLRMNWKHEVIAMPLRFAYVVCIHYTDYFARLLN